MARIVGIVLLLSAVPLAHAGSNIAPIVLDNGILRVTFNEVGIETIYDIGTGHKIVVEQDDFQLELADGRRFVADASAAVSADRRKQQATYAYQAAGFNVEVVYDLKPGWRFVSKQILISTTTPGQFTVRRIVPFAGRLGPSYRSRSLGRYGMSLRFEDALEGSNRQTGGFLLVQNPFTEYSDQDGRVSAVYEPEMNWDAADGAFASDRFCIGVFALSGHTLRADMLPEWHYVRDPDQFASGGPRIDQAEIQALTACARAFLDVDPEQSVRVHVGWCENDYQIDVATPAGRAEYKRIIDQAAAVGCQHVLYTPAHSELAPVSENRDAWSWENLLWLNLGQKIRKGQWVPGRDPVPECVQDMLDYAESKNVKLLAYVYPSLPFMQDPAWTAWLTSNGREPGGYLTVDTGLRSYQDWLIDILVDFYHATGIGGYSFDHWWIAYTPHPDDENVQVSSQYQQWYGCRRILHELRRRVPEMILDGRQQYHHFGTWTWLAGTYPHPMMSDEQPVSFNAIADLSTDRVNGARQRYVAWRLMTQDFCPIEILPGFITHQTQREDANRVMRRDRYRVRDWDMFGWKYNLLSSIATAPFNHVINYLPARDLQEFRSFSAADQAFFREWLDFTDWNAAILKHIRPILGPPMLGRCDGTSAIIADKGFIFLFNPNYRVLEAQFRLDESIGLTAGERFLLQEMYPQAGRNIGQSAQGLFAYGDSVSITMGGTSAMVLRVIPQKDRIGQPILFNAPGQVGMEDDVLTLSNVTGPVGSVQSLMVQLTDDRNISEVRVNGRTLPFHRRGDLVACEVRFGGQRFAQAQSIGSYDPEFAGQVVEETFIIPQRVFTQLQERREAWPVEYTEDDLVAPWLGPDRLLLFVHIADPYLEREVVERRDGRDVRVKRRQPIRAEQVTIEIDGQPVEVKEGYNGVYPYVERTCMGMYADISHLTPDVEYRIKVTLPSGLAPGQFQGLFFEHVEDEFTDDIAEATFEELR